MVLFCSTDLGPARDSGVGHAWQATDTRSPNRSHAVLGFALAIDWPQSRRPLAGGGRVLTAARSSPTSAPPAAACGRRPTAARRGARSPTSSSRRRRSARSRSLPRTPTSSTSAWGKPSCAATSSRATASTSPPTPARRGRTSASNERRRSLASASTRRTPTSSTSRRSAIRTAPNPERGVFRSKDGGKTWEQVLFRDDKTGAVDLAHRSEESRRALRGAVGSLPNTSLTVERRGRAAACSRARTAALTGPSSRGHGPSNSAARTRSASRSPAPTRTGSTPSSKPRTADCSFPTMRARAGGWRTRIGASGSAPSTTPASTPTRRQRTRSTSLNTGVYRSTDAGKTIKSIRVPHGDNHDLWIASNDPKRMINANDGGANVSVNGGETWTGQRLSDRAVLPRVHDHARAVSRLRRAAGQHDGVCPEQRRPATTSTTSAAARAATSRPIRSTSTSTTPAATAGS